MIDIPSCWVTAAAAAGLAAGSVTAPAQPPNI